MTLTHYSLLQAAKLLQATRKPILKGQTGDLLERVTPRGADAAAGLTPDNVLVITGSRGLKDYSFYNLRPLRPLPQMDELQAIATPDLPQEAYHQGFLLHAARVKRFLAGNKPSIIIGHSLGAASAQILGTHFQVPTLCLASPQVVKRRFLEPEGFRDRSHRQWNVFNMAWSKDFVTQGFRQTGLRCLGYRVMAHTKRPHPGIDHFVKDYERLIISTIDHKVAGLPDRWPDPDYKLPSRLA